MIYRFFFLHRHWEVVAYAASFLPPLFFSSSLARRVGLGRGLHHYKRESVRERIFLHNTEVGIYNGEGGVKAGCLKGVRFEMGYICRVVKGVRLWTDEMSSGTMNSSREGSHVEVSCLVVALDILKLKRREKFYRQGSRPLSLSLRVWGWMVGVSRVYRRREGHDNERKMMTLAYSSRCQSACEHVTT